MDNADKMVKPGAKKPHSKGNGKQKQATLFAYNFVKRVRQDGVLVNVGPTMAKTVADKTHKCPDCDEFFKTVPGLMLHQKWKHAREEPKESSESFGELFAPTRARTDEMDVKLVVKDLVSRVAAICEKDAAKKGRKGAASRKSYSYSFRMDVLTELDTGKCAADVAFEYRIHESMVSKWRRNRKAILEKAADQHRRNLRRGRPSTKHTELFKKLIVRFRAARERGKMVSFAWLYTTASKFHKEANPDAKRLSPSVVVAFVRKYKIKMRRVQRRKQKPKSDGVALMQKWHMELREGLIKTG